MNRTKIEWTTWTWNPVTGCKHGCSYCYARRLAIRFHGGFEPRFHAERLQETGKAKAGDMIFVCSMADLFGEWVPAEWIEQILEIIREQKDVIFQFLSKNPDRYHFFEWPNNCWLGTTVTKPGEEQRVDALFEIDNIIRFVSYEPLLQGPVTPYPDLDWQIIGPQTNPIIQPESEWVTRLVSSGVPTFMKPALSYKPRKEQFPTAIRKN